jgi:hypothetical protein
LFALVLLNNPAPGNFADGIVYTIETENIFQSYFPKS